MPRRRASPRAIAAPHAAPRRARRRDARVARRHRPPCPARAARRRMAPGGATVRVARQERPQFRQRAARRRRTRAYRWRCRTHRSTAIDARRDAAASSVDVRCATWASTCAARGAGHVDAREPAAASSASATGRVPQGRERAARVDRAVERARRSIATKRDGSKRAARAFTVNARAPSRSSVPLPVSLAAAGARRSRSSVTRRPSRPWRRTPARRAAVWRRSPRTTWRAPASRRAASVPDSRVAMQRRLDAREVDVGEREVQTRSGPPRRES